MSSSIVLNAYKNKGLVGIGELYSLFPKRLRESIVIDNSVIFKKYWSMLTEDEKMEFDEYDFSYETLPPDSSKIYELKIQELTKDYDRIKSERLKEVINEIPEVATSIIMDFEKAHTLLLNITKQLYENAKLREEEERRKSQEAELFITVENYKSPTEHKQTS